MTAHIVIMPYDRNWIELYNDEEMRLKESFENEYMGIMHIGSTSIEGLDAKPIIDISVGLKSLNKIEFYIEKLAPSLYKTDAKFFENDWVLFVKNEINITYHLHLMPYDSMRLIKQVLFKIYLENHPLIAQQYVFNKKYFVKYDEDIWYSMNKKPFVNEVELAAINELLENPQYWKNRIYDIMGYLPREELREYFLEGNRIKKY